MISECCQRSVIDVEPHKRRLRLIRYEVCPSHAARLLTLDSGFTINGWCEAVGFAPNVRDVMADGLGLAGLPELAVILPLSDATKPCLNSK